MFCLNHWAEVINRSSVANKARVVDASCVYDWKNELQPYFKTFEGISRFHHFAADSSKPGWIFAKYDSDDDMWEKRKLLKSDRSISTEKFKNLTRHLSATGYRGGKPEKEKALFENLRQYVKDEWKDELCPDPLTFEHPVRKERPCPDWQ